MSYRGICQSAAFFPNAQDSIIPISTVGARPNFNFFNEREDSELPAISPGRLLTPTPIGQSGRSPAYRPFGNSARSAAHTSHPKTRRNEAFHPTTASLQSPSRNFQELARQDACPQSHRLPRNLSRRLAALLLPRCGDSTDRAAPPKTFLPDVRRFSRRASEDERAGKSRAPLNRRCRDAHRHRAGDARAGRGKTCAHRAKISATQGEGSGNGP